MPSTNIFDVTRYLQSQNLEVLLGRSYKIDEFDWFGDTLGGDALRIYDFPGVLYDKLHVKTILDRYGFMRAESVTLTVRVQSTVMHYGNLCISHTYGDFSRNDSNLVRFNNRPVLLSAMPASVVEITIPYNFKYPWLSIDNLVVADASARKRIARVIIEPMTTLKTVGTDNTPVTVTVFANFNKLEVMSPSLAHDIPDPALVLQFEKLQNERHRARYGKIDAKGTKRINKYAEVVYESQSSTFEAIKKSAAGIMSDFKDEKYLDAAVDIIPLAMDVGGLVQKVGAMVLDKPQSDSGNTIIAFENGKDFICGTGIQPGVSWSLTPGAHLEALDATDNAMGHDIRALCQTPAYLDQYEILQNDITEFWSVRPEPGTPAPGDSGRFCPTFLDYFSQPFRYWQGGITYNFDFFASKFVSARVRFFWAADQVGPKAILGRTGDIISRVVDITGDTHVTVTIPYAGNSLLKRRRKAFEALPNNNLYSNGDLQLELVSPIVSQVDSPTIHMVVWVSGAADFTPIFHDTVMSYNNNFTLLKTFAEPASFVSKDETPKEEVFESQSAVWDRAGLGDPLQEVVGHDNTAYSSSEQVYDITTIAKRFQQVDRSSPFPVLSVNSFLEQGSGSRNFTTITWASLAFVYWAGSIRLKVLRASNEVGDPYHLVEVGNDGVTRVGPELAVSPANVQNEINISVPFFTRGPYLGTYEGNVTSRYFVDLEGTITAADKIFTSAGDDFRLHYLFAPPYYYLTA